MRTWIYETDYDVHTAQQAVNEWISSHWYYRILDISTTTRGDFIVITVVYNPYWFF